MKARKLCEELGIDLSNFLGCTMSINGTLFFKIKLNDIYTIIIRYGQHYFVSVDVLETLSSPAVLYSYTSKQGIIWSTRFNIFTGTFGDISIFGDPVKMIHRFKELYENGVLFEILNYDDDLDEYGLNIPVYVLNILKGGAIDNSSLSIDNDFSEIDIDILYTDKFQRGNYLSNGCIIKPEIYFKSKQDLVDFYTDDSHSEIFFQGAQFNGFFVNDLDNFKKQIESL